MMRHPLHSICPYFAMFPESFVLEQIYSYTRPNDLVFDPFCGRGTTVLESLLNHRQAIGMDINPVAACIAGAKADVPKLSNLLRRVDELEASYLLERSAPDAPTTFFAHCFHETTFHEIAYLRKSLAWQTKAVDRFLSAVMLGILHGESHKSSMCLSNRMPRTISTKPDYSVKWWQARNLTAPKRDTFDILRRSIKFRFSVNPPSLKGKVVLSDARQAKSRFRSHQGKVSLMVTSPPYIDTTDYAEDQWLRLWFLGGDETPKLRMNKDDRHTVLSEYWRFLGDVWIGCAPLLRENARVVIRIGGTKIDKNDLMTGLLASLARGMANRSVKIVGDGVSSAIAKRQTNSFRPGTSANRLEHDFSFIIK
jgi:hypothetical protein